MLFRSNDTATTELYTLLYTLSLHDALPICSAAWDRAATECVPAGAGSPPVEDRAPGRRAAGRAPLHQVAVRAGKSFLAHQMTDRAATLTYYAMMSLFPALLVGVTLLGLVGQQGLVTDATNYLLDHGVDGETANVVRRVLQNMVNASGGALGSGM